MKVTNVETFLVDVPFQERYRESTSFAFVKSKRHVFVKVHTDDGLVGFGEASSDETYSGETMVQVANVIEQELSPCLKGEDPFDLERIKEKMDMVIKPLSNNYAKFALESALYDLMGKSANLPVHKLLGGGCYRSEIPLHVPIGIVEVDVAVERARAYVENGFRAITQKVGLCPDEDVEKIKRIREAVGHDIKLGIDANQGYSRQTALRTIRRMERYELEFAEQPVAAWDFDGMAMLAEKLDTPIAADESLSSTHDALKLIQKEAADIFVIELAKHGGIYDSWKIAVIAEAANIPCRVGGSHELGIGTLPGIHLVASMKIINIPFTGLLGPVYHVSDIIKEKLAPEKGAYRVPTRAGLGAELDDEKIRKFKAQCTRSYQYAN